MRTKGDRIIMKLVTYESAKQSRLGVVQGDVVVDVAAAYGLIAKGRIAEPKWRRRRRYCASWAGRPQDMIELLGWEKDIAKRWESSWRAPAAMGKKGPKGLLDSIAHRQAACAHRAPAKDHLHRPQLRRPRARRRPGAAPGADFLPEIPQYHLRARRSHQAASQLRRRWITKRNSRW